MPLKRVDARSASVRPWAYWCRRGRGPFVRIRTQELGRGFLDPCAGAAGRACSEFARRSRHGGPGQPGTDQDARGRDRHRRPDRSETLGNDRTDVSGVDPRCRAVRWFCCERSEGRRIGPIVFATLAEAREAAER